MIPAITLFVLYAAGAWLMLRSAAKPLQALPAVRDGGAVAAVRVRFPTVGVPEMRNLLRVEHQMHVSKCVAALK